MNLTRAANMLRSCLDEGMEWPDAEWCVRDRYDLDDADWSELVRMYDEGEL